jgi:glycosyltransferase involved in cell wall biosynthesis
MTKKVIFGAFFHWNSSFHIGGHQYAKQFARNGYKVAYISKPISPLHFPFAKERDILRERFDEWRNGGKWYEKNNLWSYTPFSLIPVYRRPFLTREFIVRNANRITIPSIRSILKKNGFNNVDILFLDEPDEYLLDLSLHIHSIYRIHDDITHFKKYPAIFQAHEEVIKNVDLVVSSSKRMELLAKEVGAKKTLYLPNGVEFKHFSSGSSVLPSEYVEIPIPRIIYVGSIIDWFDVNLVAYTAKKLKNFSFVLIGKPRINISELLSLSNVYILGPRDYKLLPSYIKNADAGIMPFVQNNYIDSASPNKLYIYSSCGLPTVSMKFEELKGISSDIVYSAERKEDFVELLKEAINDKNKERYIRFARENSWESRYKKLIETLYSGRNEYEV